MSNNFSFVIPAELEKSEDGSWRIRGLASTEEVDRQGEIILQKGLDLSPIDKGRGWINLEHSADISDRLGTLDSYKHTDKGLFIEGRLFKNVEKAKAVHAIMSSLGKSDVGRIGLSVQGTVVKRSIKNPKIIEKAEISAVAVTFCPVNSSTYCDLLKSMSPGAIDFNATEVPTGVKDDAKIFTSAEVVELVQKALMASAAYASTPPDKLAQGDAISQESLDQTVKPQLPQAHLPEPKKLKKGDAAFFKTALGEIMDKIKALYPNVPEATLWSATKDRLTRKFPSAQI